MRHILKFKETFLFLCFFTLIIGCQKNISINRMLIPEAKLKLVPQDFAQTIAEKFASSSFINKKSKSNTRSTNSTPVLSNKIQNEITFKDHSNSAAFYIFNFVDDAGFLIVSADFNVNPILAYIDNGNFKNDSKVPRGFTDWINKATENQCL